MCDLVGDDIANPRKRVLEPAAGNGNFLVVILERRLQYIAGQKYKKKFDYERNVLIALANMYSIDIMEDNVEECKHRLYAIITSEYSLARNTDTPSDYFKSAAQEILNTNIILGDSLHEKGKINFIEYNINHRGIVQRQQFNLAPLERGDNTPVKVFEQSNIQNLSRITPDQVFYYKDDQLPIFAKQESQPA